MKPEPRLTHPPPGARIRAQLPGAHFHDAWAIAAARPELSPLEQFLRAARATPAWVESCMRLRNRLVQPFGLKNLGDMAALQPNRSASAYGVGDRVGIFTLFEQHSDELLLGDRDRHLDVTLSVHQTGGVVTLTTVVHVHGLLGRLYMLPVAPMHHLIAPAVLCKVGQPDSS
jgi:Protein of unknown function (DUF2867)